MTLFTTNQGEIIKAAREADHFLYLDPTIAGSEAAMLDKSALKTLNNQLTDALKQLAEKTK